MAGVAKHHFQSFGGHTMSTTEKNREQRLRRALNKVGYTLHKSRKAFSLDNLMSLR